MQKMYYEVHLRGDSKAVHMCYSSIIVEKGSKTIMEDRMTENGHVLIFNGEAEAVSSSNNEIWEGESIDFSQYDENRFDEPGYLQEFYDTTLLCKSEVFNVEIQYFELSGKKRREEYFLYAKNGENLGEAFNTLDNEALSDANNPESLKSLITF